MSGAKAQCKFDENIAVLSSKDKSPLFNKVEINCKEIVDLSKKLLAEGANQYIASDSELETVLAVKQINNEVFAELPMQAGWCFGGGVKMNGMEWHKSSEVVVACADCVLLLGRYEDVVDDKFDSKNAVALKLSAGEAVELLPLTLHLAPLAIKEFFKVAILLPKGTNAPLKQDIDGTKRAVNKWLLVHSENKKGIEIGGKIGIIGKNIALIK